MLNLSQSAEPDSARILHEAYLVLHSDTYNTLLTLSAMMQHMRRAIRVDIGATAGCLGVMYAWDHASPNLRSSCIHVPAQS